MPHIPGRVLLLAVVALLVLAAAPAFAVWPLPSYSTYPCTAAPSPASNCLNQGGDPEIHRQMKLSERSVAFPSSTSCTPVSGQFGGFCDGPGCTSQAGFCKQPSILGAPTAEVLQFPDGTKIRFHVEYDFPGNYCQLSPDGDVAEWPIVFNDYHLNRLEILDASGNNVLASSMAVFEHGQWNPLLPACGGGTYKIRVISHCAGANQTVDLNVPVPSSVSLTSCSADRNCCLANLPRSVGRPINVGSGDVSVALPLFSVAQSPLGLGFELTYHSALPGNTRLVSEPLGRGWTHPFNESLRPVEPSADVLYRLTPSGDEVFYTRTAPNGATWNAAAPGEVREQVTLAGSQFRLKDLDGTVTAFDAVTGSWLSTTDRWGNSISGAYTAGALTTITDAEGRQVQFVYTGGLLTQITVSGGEVWRFGYAGGELAQIYDPLHTGPTPWRSFDYTSDTRHQLRLLTAMRDEAGKLLEGHAYDNLERGVTSTGENGRDLVTLSYNGASPTQTIVTHSIDAATTETATFTLLRQRGRFLPTVVDGNCYSCGGGGSDVQHYEFDGSNHPLAHTDGSGHVTRYTYDANGNVLSRVDAAGTPDERTTTFTYGLPTWPRFMTSTTETSAAKPGAVKTTALAWNTTGTPESVLTVTETGYLRAADPAAVSYVRKSTYDARHRLVSEDGPRTDVSDVTARSYYADDDTIAARRGRLQSTTDAAGLTTRYDAYDTFGTARSVIDANGVEIVTETDGRGRVRSQTNKAVAGDPREAADYMTTSVYDGRDRLIRSTRPAGNGSSFEYEDGTNRLTDTIRLDATGRQTERHHVTFNLIGNKTREEEQQCASPAAVCTGWVTRRQQDFTYDDHNRLARTTQPDGAFVAYAWEPNGLLKNVQDENHAQPNSTYSYDALDRLRSVSQTLGGGSAVTSYSFDAQNNVAAIVDPNGNRTTYAYDDFHRLQQQVSPVTGTTSYTYDPAGNLVQTTDANGAVTTRVYDAVNRLRSSSSTRAGVTETLTNTYDSATAGSFGKGRLATMSDPSGSIAYAYDRRGHLRAESHAVQGNSYALAYAHDANGNRSAITYPSGRIVNYSFDSSDRPLTATTGGTTLVSSASYLPSGPESQLVYGNGTTRTMSYDLRYRPLENKLGSGLGLLADYGYSLDPAGNITAIRDLVDPAYSRTFGYDDLNRLTTANSGGALWGTGSYSYDAMGNMKTLALGASRTAAFQYNGTLPQLAGVTENGNARVVMYDAAGNEVTAGATASAYSPRNLLAAADGLAYAYDGRGLRTITTVTAAVGTLSGTVVAASGGAAVSGATVTIDGTLNATTTDAAGAFSLNAPAGNYTVTAVKPGFLAETSTAFTLAAGSSVNVGSLKLSVAPSTISGTVAGSLGGTVAGATVTIAGTNNSATTDVAGRFTLTQAAGTATLSLSAPGYTALTTAPFTTSPGQQLSLGTITLQAIPATISGTVLTSAGTPVAGATVSSGSASGFAHAPVADAFRIASNAATATTDANGNFSLALAAGTYALTIAKSGFATTTTGGISVGPGASYATGTITVDPLAAITGLVVAEASGNPVANASVQIAGSLTATTTDAAGRFSVTIPAGSYAVNVTASGFAQTTTPFFAVAPGTTKDAGTIRLPAVALAVYVGYADDLRPSSAFPTPWSGDPNVLYIGTPSPLDAGAIRLDNSTDTPMEVTSVTVDLGRPGPAYDLWGSFTIPAHGQVILTQTEPFNFDTSDSPIVACGGTLITSDPRVPRVVVHIGGAATTYFDTGHILDTGGFDLACRGNESLQWRLIGTTGIATNGDFVLGPPTGRGTLGQPYTVTATAIDANGQPMRNVAVTFRVIAGPNSGTSGSASTDSNGKATFAYTSSTAGNDTILATIANASGGSLQSNPVAVNWPALSNLEVFVGYADDLRAGAAFPNPWQGSPGVVFIGNRGGDWDSGAVRLDNTSDQPVTVDRVVVDLQRPGPSFNLWGSFTIPAHGQAILAQTGPGENFDTSDFVLTGCGGTLAPNDPRIPKITVTVGGLSSSYLDTSHILDTFGYDLACIGNESLQWRPVGSSSVGDVGHLVLLPPSATALTGASDSVTAVATDAGNEPIANLPVDFRIVTGPNAGRTARVVTGDSGLATFTYSGTATGTDTIRASNTNSIGAVLTSNDVRVNWIATARIQLSPDTRSLVAGTPYNATAHVTDGGGAPLANVSVTFRITAGPNSGKSGQSTTNAAGDALFTYFSSVTGTDLVVASIAGAAGNNLLSNQVSVTWTQPLSLTLAPSTSTNAVGAAYTATATALSGSTAAASLPIRFDVLSGPNAGRTFTATTDTAGRAAWSYTGTATGTDVIQAFSGTLGSNQVLATWTAVATRLVYTGPAAAEFNDPAALTARLTDASTGNPIPAQTIQFTFGSQTLTGTTDAAGTARVTVTPSAVGTVPLTLRFAGAGQFTGSSAAAFVAVVRDETVLTYTGKAAVANGTAQTLTALLDDPDGHLALANKPVTFTIGPITATVVTNAAGVASTTVIIPASLGTGPIRVFATFAGDANYVPASASAPVILFAPSSFAIWGGNTVPPRIGDHVNFWGSQWEKQVTGGDFEKNAAFKGYASPTGSPIAPCRPAAHIADAGCWSSKGGNASPPASLERYISVLVPTSIAKVNSDTVGNIAAVVVVRVDALPAYAADPGHPGYGTIVAVVADAANLFPASAAPSQVEAPPFFFRHYGSSPKLASLQPFAFATSTFTQTITPVLKPAPLAVASGNRRYSFYSPESTLLAETAIAAGGAPAIAHEYVWFNGHPVAQIDNNASIHWTFTDHLGTPLLQTDAAAQIWWRAEYEPFGAIYALRSPDVHQPLRLPGQEAEQLDNGANGTTEREYNVHRWYRAGWGRYTQADPIGILGKDPFRDRRRWKAERPVKPSWTSMSGGPRTSAEELAGVIEPYAYASNSPLMFKDPLGLSPCPAFRVFPKSDYIQGHGLPPGKTIKGCAYVGLCGLAKPKFIGIYEKTDVPIGCDCPQFCLLFIDDYTGEPTKGPVCFNFAFPGVEP